MTVASCTSDLKQPIECLLDWQHAVTVASTLLVCTNLLMILCCLNGSGVYEKPETHLPFLKLLLLECLHLLHELISGTQAVAKRGICAATAIIGLDGVNHNRTGHPCLLIWLAWSGLCGDAPQ